MQRSLLATLPLLLATAASQAAQCGAFPQLEVTTLPGQCAAVLATGFKFPRGVQPMANGDIYVVDMGNWEPRRGTLWRLRPAAQGYARTALFQRLDRPNGITAGPDGWLYVGVVGGIFRFDPANPQASRQDVIGGASGVTPLPGKGRHLLTSMRFDRSGDLYVNIGSASDHCESPEGKAPDTGKPCAEAEGNEALGSIRKYSLRWPGGSVRTWETYARGLRNSMAMAVHPASNALWQADNARDAIQAAMPGLKNDNDLPHDELNLVERGRHYGWPYCFDQNRASPEYPKADCRPYNAPDRLLPAHAAPLGMLFYTGALLPQNSLVISYHGYRQHGHRVVALMPDKGGAPLGKSIDVISDWGPKPQQEMGAPVDIKQGADGSLYIVEDRSKRLIRLQQAR
jgi:glucose/arabinose dehydrogenase